MNEPCDVYIAISSTVRVICTFIPRYRKPTRYLQRKKELTTLYAAKLSGKN